MAQVKVAVVGAGSFVFGPSVLYEALVQLRLTGLELALMDVSADSVELMAGVGRRLVADQGLPVTVSAHTSLATALPGASFVVCSAARELLKRFQLDAAAIAQHAPDHLTTEFGGVAGISYSLRQIALIEDLTNAMKQHCPGAWLLTCANPLPRVCQAAHENGVRTVGFCSVSSGLLGDLWHLFHGTPLPFPWTVAQERWQLTMAGLNHFAWLLGLTERATGHDLLPEFRRRRAGHADPHNPRREQLYRDTGYLVATADGHTRDFLSPLGATADRHAPHHGTAAEREQRLVYLQAVAAGTAPADGLHVAWEKPMHLVAGMAFGRQLAFNSLNLINEGQIPNLPRHVYVETPAVATAAGPVPSQLSLPATVLPYCERTALVTATIVRAARERSRQLVHAAVELDPTIVDKTAGRAAMDACLAAHADLLPPYR